MLNNKVRSFRGSLAITQKALADAVGVTRQTIAALEKERYNPSLELAFRIARYFKAGIEDVFEFREERQRYSGGQFID
jgi:putative transcriptional regulator